MQSMNDAPAAVSDETAQALVEAEREYQRRLKREVMRVQYEAYRTIAAIALTGHGSVRITPDNGRDFLDVHLARFDHADGSIEFIAIRGTLLPANVFDGARLTFSLATEQGQ